MPPNKVTISLSGAHQYVEDGLSLTPFVTSIEEGDNSQKAIIAMNTPDFDGRIHYYINDNEIWDLKKWSTNVLFNNNFIC